MVQQFLECIAKIFFVVFNPFFYALFVVLNISAQNQWKYQEKFAGTENKYLDCHPLHLDPLLMKQCFVFFSLRILVHSGLPDFSVLLRRRQLVWNDRVFISPFFGVFESALLQSGIN